MNVTVREFGLRDLVTNVEGILDLRCLWTKPMTVIGTGKCISVERSVSANDLAREAIVVDAARGIV